MATLVLNTTTPSPEHVYSWFRAQGFNESVVGQSYQDRPLKLFEWNGGDVASDHQRPSLFLLSLIHGHEPMGLLALMEAVHVIVQENVPVKLVVVPIVNIGMSSIAPWHYSRVCKYAPF